MAKLQMGRKEVDLDKVKDLSDEEYEGLLYRARQLDDPEQDSWVEQIQQARGDSGSPRKRAAVDPNEGFRDEAVPDGTVADILEWVGDDSVKAGQALAVELDKSDPRKTLVEALEDLAG